MRLIPFLVTAAAALAGANPLPGDTNLPWPSMARRIVEALRIERGERVMLRFDPQTMRDLEPQVARLLRAAGAQVESHPFGPLADFASRLDAIDVYVWLPAGPNAPMPPGQSAALVDWIDKRPDRRELHFHWVDGTRDVDGLPAPHQPAYDRVYLDALDIDYAQLAAQMDAAIAELRNGEVRVTTPAGTDVRFRVGDRPFNRQTGDASKANARRARIRIDRHTELPAGVLRVAPIESSVNGNIMLPSARFGGVRATEVRLTFRNGAVAEVTAASGVDAVKAFLASEPGANRFRELALGFNPKLVVPPGERALPYYGYGAGVVRMSVGDNSELGGEVRGGGVRWLFFPDATVTIGGRALVEAGRLRVPQQSSARVRARGLGIPLDGTPGPLNAITDVRGLEVGMITLISGDGALKRGTGPVRTGVTAILPRGKTFDPVFAASYALNGNGEMTGTAWIAESGFLEGPLAITNTHSVGVVRDAIIDWMVTRNHLDPVVPGVFFQYPLVAETWDGALNDINGFHMKREHVLAALDGAVAGPVAEGNVGGGTGMVCMGFKGGTGTASRVVHAGAAAYTVGALVQANFGRRETFVIAGVPIGREITDLQPTVKFVPDAEVGSIIVIVATDAPLLPHQLARLARRVPLGLGRVGGIGGNSSGDIFLAFSTANPGAFKREGLKQVMMLPNDQLDPLFSAVIESVEESILNALTAATTMTGINGNTVHAMPHDRVRLALQKYNRLK